MSDPRFVSNNPAPPGHPSSGSYSPGPAATPPSSGNNNQLRNVVIGAIITVCSSVIIYYLTVYMNKGKAESGGSSYLEMKEATQNAWKRYVDIDNIYYKSILLLAKDNTLTSNLDRYSEEISKEGDRFKKDAEAIMKEKNVDPAFTLMISRRLEREAESNKESNRFYAKLKAISSSNADDSTKLRQLQETMENFQIVATRVLKTAGAEVEALSKTLSQTYGQAFNLDEVLLYKDYKMAMSRTSENSNNLWAVAPPDSSKFAKNVSAKSLTGEWNDNGTSLALLKDGNMKYSMASGDEASGTWKIENDKLRLDVTDTETNRKNVFTFYLSDIAAGSFTAILSSRPYDTYHLVRTK
jgi:hypothetical protein